MMITDDGQGARPANENTRGRRLATRRGHAAPQKDGDKIAAAAASSENQEASEETKSERSSGGNTNK